IGNYTPNVPKLSDGGPNANPRGTGCTSVRCRAWLGRQAPPIPIVLRVRVKHQASGVVGHQYKPATRDFCTIDIAQFEESAFRPGRIQFVPDELRWFCFLCRVGAFLHFRYPFRVIPTEIWCKSFVTSEYPLPPNVRSSATADAKRQ